MPVPGKFDDIQKTAKSVLNDDFDVKDVKFEVKSKTNLDGAIATVAVDCKTGNPAKLTWKFPKMPKPFVIPGFAIDKFEYDSKSAMKLECSAKKEMHAVDGLVVDAKSPVFPVDVPKATMGLTYTGIKDAAFKFETKPAKLEDFTCECLYGSGPLVIGAQFKGLTIPSLAANYTYSNFFGALVAKSDAKKKAISDITLFGHCKVDPKIAVAGSCTSKVGGDKTFAIGATADVASGVKVKAKADSNQVVSALCKADIVKGFGLTLVGSYNAKAKEANEKMTYGVKLNIE